MSRQAYTQDDKDNLAAILLTFPKAERTTPATHRQVALKLPGHTYQSWHTHYRDHKPDIDRRIEKLRRQRDRDWDEQKRRSKGKGKGKGKSKAEQSDSDDEDVVDDEEQDPPRRKASTSTGTKQQRRSAQATDDSDVETTQSRSKSAPKKQTRVPFDEDKDWERLILALVKGRDNDWSQGDIFKYLGRKYREHTQQSWYTWWRKNQKEVQEAVEGYLEERAQLTAAAAESESDLATRKEKKREEQQQTAPRPSTSNPAKAQSSAKPKGKAAARAKPVTTVEKFDSPSPSLASDAGVEIVEKPVPPQPARTSSKHKHEGKEKAQQHEVSVSEPSGPTHPTRQLDPSPFADDTAAQPASAPVRTSTSRSTQPSSEAAPPAHRATSTSAAARAKPDANSARPVATRAVRPSPAPLPPVATVAPSPRSLAQSRSNLAKAAQVPLPLDDEDDVGFFEEQMDDPEPDRVGEMQGERGERGLDEPEPSTQNSESSSNEGRDEGRDDDRMQLDEDVSAQYEDRDAELLVHEMCRSEWMEMTKQSAFETLFILYPWHNAKEWEAMYLARRPDFMHSIALAIEKLEDEGEGSDMQQTLAEEKVVQELTRCELLGLEKNLVAWDNLSKLYPRMSEQEWKAFHGKTKRSIWQKRIAENVKRIVDERIARQGGGQAEVDQRRDRRTQRHVDKEISVKERKNKGDKGKQRARREPRDVTVDKSARGTGNVETRVEPASAQDLRRQADRHNISAPPTNPAHIDPEPTTNRAASALLAPALEPAKRPATSTTQQSRARRTQPPTSRKSPVPSPPPTIDAARLAPPTPSRRPTASAESPPRITQPREPSRSQSPHKGQRSRPSVSVSPRPVERRLSPCHEAQTNQAEEEDSKDEDEEESQVDEPFHAIEVDRETIEAETRVGEDAASRGSARTTATTSSDRQVIEHLEKAVAAEESPQVQVTDEHEGANLTRENEDVEMDAARVESDVEDRDGPGGLVCDDSDLSELDLDLHSPFDASNPFQHFDPSEPIWEELTEAERDLGLGHVRVLQLAQEVDGREREEAGTRAAPEVERDAALIEGGSSQFERKAKFEEDPDSAAKTLEQKELVQEDVAGKQDGIAVLPHHGQKRRRSEHSGSEAVPDRDRLDEQENVDRPRKKPRIGSAVPSTTSSTMSKEDVGQWRERVQTAQHSALSPSAVGPVPKASPRIPCASLAAAATAGPRDSRTKPTPDAGTTSPSTSAPTVAPPRMTNPTASQNLNSQLASIASTFGVPFALVAGLYFCLCAPNDLATFAKYVKFYSTRAPPRSSKQWEKMRRAVLKSEWTYDEDKVVLEGTEEEKDELRQRKGPKSIETRKTFLSMARKDAVAKLPLENYERRV